MITLRYFAQLFEACGLSEETLEPQDMGLLPNDRALDWYESLAKKYGFSLDSRVVRPAINGAYTSWDARVKDGDELAFIPPVAGG